MRTQANIIYREKLSQQKLLKLERKMLRKGVIIVFRCVKMLLQRASEYTLLYVCNRHRIK